MKTLLLRALLLASGLIALAVALNATAPAEGARYQDLNPMIKQKP